MTRAPRAYRRLLIGLLAVGLIVTTLSIPAVGADDPIPVRQDLPLEEESVVRILIPGSEELYALQDAGFDLAGGFERVAQGIEIDAVLTASQIAALGDFDTILAEDAPEVVPQPFRMAMVDAENTDTVTVGRVDWFTTKGQGFLSIEAKSDANQSAALNASWDGGSVNVGAYVDSGEYMFHRVQVPVDGPRPDTVTVTSSLGGSDTGPVTDWLFPTDVDIDRPGYESGFIDAYMNPTQLYDRLEELAEEYPHIAEIVELPHTTNGYRRKAQAVLGSANANRVALDSHAWGHEGGNDVSVALVNPGAPSSPLGVTVDGNAIQVSLATNATGALSSTAAQVVNAINDTPAAAALVVAYRYRNNAGTGVVAAAPPTLLSDFLTAPEEISREPWRNRALRIGVNRDGSKTGVLIVAQDHAREWVTPLVALEAAERLLANSTHDATTRKVLRNVDIFIVPSNNPDGSHYSFFDRSAQRRNMTNHCPRTGSADALARGTWGVDLNRNFRVGSGHDGYSGASTSCTSDTYQGPEKLSEPEAKNVVWLADTYDNLKFFMTVHSNGGQLFWQPGSYIAQGRITTPRPPLRDESYYWTMAEDILSNVKGLRDSVVQPRNVGGSSDVLYSSAGNVREDLYNNYGIYAFGWEVGGDQWNPATRTFTSGGGFMPQWPEANQQYQEYASGVIKMFELAMEYELDHDPARTQLHSERQANDSVNVTFSMSEPATIYYTTDGSTPTTDSTTYEAANIREPGEVLNITQPTTFKWFSVDVKGNVEVVRSVNLRAKG